MLAFIQICKQKTTNRAYHVHDRERLAAMSCWGGLGSSESGKIFRGLRRPKKFLDIYLFMCLFVKILIIEKKQQIFCVVNY